MAALNPTLIFAWNEPDNLGYNLAGVVVQGLDLVIVINNLPVLTNSLNWNISTEAGITITGRSNVGYLDNQAIIVAGLKLDTPQFNLGATFKLKVTIGSVVGVEVLCKVYDVDYTGNITPPINLDLPVASGVILSNLNPIVDLAYYNTKQAGKQAKHSIVVGFDSYCDYICDGVADNVEIQAAIDLVTTQGGGHITLKNGNYQIIQEVILKQNITIEGQGEKTILDGTLIPTIATPGSDLRYIFKTLQTAGKKDIHVRKIKFVGRYTPGIGVEFAQLPSIGGVLINYTTNVSVTNCIFTQTYNAATTGLGSTSYGPYDVATNNVTNVLFKNNYCEDVWGGLQCYLTSDVIWDGNYFKNVGDDCCAFLNVTTTAIKNAICVNNIFVNNNYVNSLGSTNRGILFKTDEGGTPGSSSIQNVVVSNNHISQAFRGIMVSSTTGAIISNNTILDSAESAIRVETEMTDLVIDNNIIRNSNTTGNVNEAAILIPASDRVKISNNKFYGRNAVGEKTISTQTTSNVTIDSNEFLNCGGRIVATSPSNTVKVINNTFVNASNTDYDILLETCSNQIEVTGNTITGAVLNRPVYITNSTRTIFNDNKLNACNRGVLVECNAATIIESLIIKDNLVTNFTGSTVDGEVCIWVTSLSTAAQKYIDLSGNQITDNNNAFYLGLLLRLAGTLKALKVTNNIVTGNKYGLAINPNIGTPAITYSIITNNIFSGNVTYNLNTFASVFTNPISANNHTV